MTPPQPQRNIKDKVRSDGFYDTNDISSEGKSKPCHGDYQRLPCALCDAMVPVPRFLKHGECVPKGIGMT